MTEEDKKVCFVIAPIGTEGSPERKRSDQILRHLVQPAVADCGYDAIRSDQISEPGVITSQVIDHVVNDPMVVADLTGRNPNVFYELAIRHATGKPVVQIIQEGERLPFDVASQRTIFVDHTDLDSVAKARADLVAQVKAAEAGERSDNPITVSVDLNKLRGSDDPVGAQLAALSESVGQVMALIEERLPATVTVHVPEPKPSTRAGLTFQSITLPEDYITLTERVLAELRGKNWRDQLGADRAGSNP